MIFRRWTLFCLMLVLGAVPGMAQNTPNRHSLFSISGSIRDESNKQAMASILVNLKQDGGTPLTTTYTRQEGDFEFDGLPNGDYIIEVTLKDYEPARQTVSINGANQLGIYIFLNRVAKNINPPLQLSISAHQLSVPHKAHDEFEKGMSLIYLKLDYRGAINQFQLAIKDFPTYYEAYAEVGAACYSTRGNGSGRRGAAKIHRSQLRPICRRLVYPSRAFQRHQTHCRCRGSRTPGHFRRFVFLARSLRTRPRLDNTE